MAGKKKRKKAGQPTKYKPEYVQQAGELCREKGYTDENLTVHFKVKNAAFYEWKKKYPEFAEAIKKGKDDFDSRVVEQSLLKRATGYSYNEITKEREQDEDGESLDGVMVVTKIVKKEISPDVTAQIFWLKNRNPKRWKDVKKMDVTGLSLADIAAQMTNGRK